MATPFPQVQVTQLISGVVPYTFAVTNLSQTLLSLNQSRLRFSIVYPATATGILYVTYGTTSAANRYSYYLNPGDILVSDLGEWYGAVSVISTVVGPENIIVTELI